jgi:hypothetical protein
MDRQRRIIDELRCDGHSARKSEALLPTFQEILTAHQGKGGGPKHIADQAENRIALTSPRDIGLGGYSLI